MDLDVKQIPSLRTSGKIQRAKKPDRGVFLSRMTPELLDPVLRLLRLLGKPEDSAVLAPLLQREILYRLCVASKANNLSECTIGWQCQRHRESRHLVKENFDKPFSIKLIAEQTNMSPSGLHHHFKTLTNMNTLQYQKHLRLQRLDGSCWPTEWMLLLRRITLVMRAGHSSAGIQPSLWSPATSGCGADPVAASASRIVKADMRLVAITSLEMPQ